jgi:hypothetical protein
MSAEIDELVITPLYLASWRAIDLAGKDRHGRRDRHVHGVKVLGVVFPGELAEEIAVLVSQ